MNLVLIFSFIGIDISSTEVFEITLISDFVSAREINTQEELRVLTRVFTTNILWVMKKSKRYLGTIIYLPSVRSNWIDYSLYSLIVVILGFLFLSKWSKWHSPSFNFQIDNIDFLSFSNKTSYINKGEFTEGIYFTRDKTLIGLTKGDENGCILLDFH